MLTDELKADIVKRVRSVVEPERVIVLGSYARGEVEPGSDIDIMVIADYEGTRAASAGKLYRAFRGFGIPKDILLVKPEKVERFRCSQWSVIYAALKEGVTVYAG